MTNDKFTDIDGYIKLQPKEIIPTLEKLRQTIKKAAPGAVEVISYQMPAFKQNGILIWFAAFTKHYSIFLRPVYLDVFREELSIFKMTKSAVNIPLDTPVPVQLISKIVKYVAMKNEENSKKKKSDV